MTFDSTSGGTNYSRGFNSQAQKRELLWNIVEPGDPYDIKKSLIAKLPGDRHTYMGDCLEMVCLFQAAEIQRLIENLDEYRLKYKEIERRELDRHSYEIQIKELAQQLSESEGLRIEIGKLKEFIRKQSLELEEEKKKTAGIDVNLQNKYNSSLNQIESMFQELNQTKAELQSWRSRYEALDRTRIRQLEDLRNSMDVHRKSQLDRQVRDLSVKFNLERSQMEIEIRRLKEALDARSRESEEWRLKAVRYETQLNEANSRFGHTQQLEKRVGEYEIRMSGLTQNLELLDRQLKDKTSELISLSGQYREFQAEYSRREVELRQYAQRISTYEQELQKRNRALTDLQGRFNQLSEQNSRLTEYENKVALLSQQIQRLNMVLKNTLHDKNDLATKYNQLNFDFESLKNTVNRQTAQLDETYQSKFTAMAQQIERLGRERKDFEMRYTRLETEYSQDRIKLNQYTTEIERLVRELNIANSKIGDVDRLGRINGQLQAQVTRLANQQRELTLNNQRIGSEASELRRQVNVFTEENNLLKKRLLELGDMPKKINDYESRLALMAKEHERMNELIRQHENESQSKLTVYVRREEEYVRRVQQLEANFRQLQAQYDKVHLQAEQLSRENVNLAQRTADIDRLNKSTIDLQGSVNKLVREKQEVIEESRIAQDTLRQTNNNLQRLMSEQSDLKQRYGSLHQENEQLKNSFANAASDVSRKLAEAENRLAQANVENEALKRRLNDSNNQLASRVNSYDQRIASYEQRIVSYESKISSYEQKILLITRESEDLKRQAIDLKKRSQENGDVLRRLNEYEDKFAMLSMEMERLNEKLRLKSVEAGDWEARFKQTAAERDQLDQIAHDLQQQLHELKESSRKLQDYENEIRQLSQQVEKMSKSLRSKVDELSRQQLVINEMTGFKDKCHELERQLESRKRKLDDEINRIEGDYNQKVKNYEAMLATLRKQNDELRKKAGENTEINRRAVEYENKLALVGQQVERLNEKLRIKVEQLASWEAKCKQLAKERDELDQIAHDLQSRLQSADEQYSLFESSINERDRTIAGLNRRIAEIDGMNREVSNLQERLNQILSENNKLKDDLLRSEEALRSASSQTALVVRERDELARKLRELQNTVANLSNEVERLNQVLRRKLDENDSLTARLTEAEKQSRSVIELQSRISIITREKETLVLEAQKNLSELPKQQEKLNSAVRQNQDLRRKVSELNELLKKVNEQEAKVLKLSQENERLGSLLEQRNKQYQQLNQRLGDSQQLNRTIRQLQERLAKLASENSQLTIEITTIQQTSALQITRAGDETRELRSRLQSAQQDSEELRRRLKDVDGLHDKLSDYENKMSFLTKEIERLNIVLKAKVDEVANLQKANHDLAEQNRKLKIRIDEVSANSQQKYEGRIAQLDQEILRLNEVLRRKVEDLETWEHRYQQLYTEREELIRISHELQQKLQESNDIDQVKLGEYESTISKLGREIQRLNGVVQRLNNDNEQLRKDLNEVDSSRLQYENRIALMSQEIERLNGVLRGKLQELKEAELKLQRAGGESNETKQRLAMLSGENEDLKLRLLEWSQKLEVQVKNRTSSYEQRLIAASRELQEYRRRLPEYENSIGVLRQQIERLNQTLKQKLDLENRSAHLVQEIERLNNVLRIKVQESQEWEQKYTELYNRYRQHEVRTANLLQELEKLQSLYNQAIRDNDQYKRRTQDLEQKFAKLNAEFERLNAIITDLKQQNYRLKQELSKHDYQSLEEMNRHLSAEIERLNKIIKQLEQDVSELRIRLSDEISLHKRIQEHLALFVVLFAQIESLRKRVKDKEREVEDVMENADDIVKAKLGKIGEMETMITNLEKEKAQLSTTVTYLAAENAQLHARLTQGRDYSKEQGNPSEDWRKNQQQLKRNIESISRQNHMLKRQVEQYQRRMAMLTQQIERLNSVLHIKQNELNEFRDKPEGGQPHRSTSPKSNNQDVAQEYENRVALMSQEIERLNALLSKSKQTEKRQVANLCMEIERLNNLLRNKVEECASFESKYYQLRKEFEHLEDAYKHLRV